MPEGDTIHRTAATLGSALSAERVTAFEAPRLRSRELPRPGEFVERVEARGKHLLIRFSGGLTLHSHLRMTGSWHLYRHGERWRRTAGAMVARIGTEPIEAVCFSAPVLEVLRPRDLARHPVLGALGPDLCLADADLEEVLARLRTLDPATPIGDALLDQSVASGIGNVYRAEALWASGLDPFRRVGDLDDASLLSVAATANRLLRSNLGTVRRTTVPGGLAVYERAGRPCARCAATIVTRRHGTHGRSVWWCPGCQR
jgi:endonuclease VIII